MGGGYNLNTCCLPEIWFLFIDWLNLFIYLLILILTQGYGFSLLLEREEQIERDRETSTSERNIDCLPSVCAQTRDWTCNLGMCLDQESNPQPVGIMGWWSNQLSHLARAKRLNWIISCFLLIFKDFYLFISREREGKEKERQRNINVWLPLTCPLLGTWPTTQACALTGNQTATLWFIGPHSIH